MSADNWTECPRCARRLQRRKAEAKKVADTAYGKVSLAEFERLKSEAKKIPTEPEGTTLREDYELGVNEDGRFSMSYSASCGECGFEFSYEHAEDVPGVDA